jgi:hypothetical protein
MKNLLRCLALSAVLLTALTGSLSAKAQPSSAPESACPNGGRCSISGADCFANVECGRTGGTCVCF